MRKNLAAVLEAWQCNKPKGKSGDSIWTDGYHIYSYSTWILSTHRLSDTDSIQGPLSMNLKLNTTFYSPTTSCHQKAIYQHFNPTIEVSNNRNKWTSRFQTFDDQPIDSKRPV